MFSASYSRSASKGRKCVPAASSLQAGIKIDSVPSGLIEGMPLAE
jgi:hypothetical protein